MIFKLFSCGIEPGPLRFRLAALPPNTTQQLRSYRSLFKYFNSFLSYHFRSLLFKLNIFLVVIRTFESIWYLSILNTKVIQKPWNDTILNTFFISISHYYSKILTLEILNTNGKYSLLQKYQNKNMNTSIIIDKPLNE